ncbi:MAG: hypothetical protein IJH84_13230 [Saccharopolyspora sp.]|uniref:zinc finger protein n=1 Tax=Saccharopolyspora sp. TaxID=33915 RepID=UPI0025D337DC|nr:zinc finger protein [Saccharopolyspora sp.]MBQ6641974.1 hypothetical protein [Saccharopolyspora sp.]
MSHAGMCFPIVYWRPFGGARHALPPVCVPYPGLECATLCGISTTLGMPEAREWLDPSCADCVAKAQARLDERRKSLGLAANAEASVEPDESSVPAQRGSHSGREEPRGTRTVR